MVATTAADGLNAGVNVDGPLAPPAPLGRDARVVPTDTTAQTVAGKNDPVESGGVLSRFTARVVHLSRALREWVAGLFGGQTARFEVQPVKAEQPFALEWLAGDRPINLDNFKELTAEGGELNLLYRTLEGISEKAQRLLEQEFRSVAVRDWASGSDAARKIILSSGEYTRISLAHELNQWGAAALDLIKAVNQSDSLAASVQSATPPTLAWLVPGVSTEEFCGMLNNLDHLSKSKQAWSIKYDAAALLYKDVRGISVGDWGCEEGSAKRWFTYASDADKAHVTRELAGWMADAIQLMARAGLASVRV